MQSIWFISRSADRVARMAQHLEFEGFSVTVVTEPSTVQNRALTEPNLIIVDIDVLGAEGFRLLAELRKLHQHTSIVVLTASTEDADLQDAFRQGASDVLPRQISLVALTERIRVNLAKRRESADDTIVSGRLTLDPSKRTVVVDRQFVKLAPMEFDLLHALVRAGGNVLSPQDILSRVWDVTAKVETETIKTHIKQLRRKLKPHGLGKAIETVSRRGYAWRPPEM